jgi:hypothetical protein
MKGPAPLNGHTLARVERLFKWADRSKANEHLLGWTDQRFCDKPSEAERVRFAALKVSDGDLQKLAESIEMANMDYRDLLVTAGFASHHEQHQWWWPENKVTPLA